MEWLSAENFSAEGAKQCSPGRKPRKSEVGKQTLNGRHRFFRYGTTCVAPAGLPLCQSLTQGSGRCAASTLGFAVSRFQRYFHVQAIAIPLLQVTSCVRRGIAKKRQWQAICSLNPEVPW
jgi:hypothetical protein